MFLHPMALTVVWLYIDRPTTSMPFQIPSGLWKPAIVCRLSQNEILFVCDVSLLNGKHGSTLSRRSSTTFFAVQQLCCLCSRRKTKPRHSFRSKSEDRTE